MKHLKKFNESIEKLEVTNESIDKFAEHTYGLAPSEAKLKDKINEIIDIVNELEKEVKELKKNK